MIKLEKGLDDRDMVRYNIKRNKRLSPVVGNKALKIRTFEAENVMCKTILLGVSLVAQNATAVVDQL